MDLVTMIMACSLYSDYSTINAMVQTGSQNQALMITTEGGNPTVFPSATQAVNFANAEIQQGHNVNIGLMQIPSRWLSNYNVTPTDLMLPCKNIQIGSRILLDAQHQCAQTTTNVSAASSCALSMYKTGDATAGSAYAQNVIKFANANPFVNPETTPTAAAPAAPPVTPATTPKHHHHKTKNTTAPKQW